MVKNIFVVAVPVLDFDDGNLVDCCNLIFVFFLTWFLPVLRFRAW